MKTATEKLWRQQDKHKGDRWRLFRAIGDYVDANWIFYPGSFVDISPSFVFPDVTYLDVDKRAAKFFADTEGILELIAAHTGAPEKPRVAFIHGDYSEPLDLPLERFDLLISLYAGFISAHCTKYLKKGGMLLVNPSHGDTALASIDPRYELAAVVIARDGTYTVRDRGLDEYLVQKKPVALTPHSIQKLGRGVGYTKSAFAYLFRKIE